MTFGPTACGDFISPRAGSSLVQALRLAPVGYVVQPDGSLAHRAGGWIQRGAAGLDVSHVAGFIESAWETDDGVDVVLHLADEAVQIRRALLGLERARRLR